MDAQLRPSTRRFLEERPVADRRVLGQYFTPKAVRDRLLSMVDVRPGMLVLDPGAGTGEFLLDILERQPKAKVEGWEIDPTLGSLCQASCGPRTVRLKDALLGPWEPKFDLVVGNPPYYEIRGRKELVDRFSDVVSGRPNVFSMFFKAGLAALKPGGRLAFVVPPSMNNGAYFAALRRFILEHASIERLEILKDPHLFCDAQQSVMLLVLRKRPGSTHHVIWFDRGSGRREPLFVGDPGRLKALTRGTRRLVDLGYSARTGRCVWNQRRTDLRASPTEGTVPLIWSQNIGEGRADLFDAPRPGRPQFVVERAPDHGPAVVVNRVVGTVGEARLRAGMIPPTMSFVAENHVNVIMPAASNLFAEPLVGMEELLRELLSDRVATAARLITGNTQLSATELNYLLPLRV